MPGLHDLDLSAHGLEEANSSLQRAFEAFAEEISVHFATSFQTGMTCRLSEVRQTTARDLLESHAHPACRLLLRLEAAPVPGCLTVSAEFGSFLIQLLLGAPAGVDLHHLCQWTELERDLLHGFLTGLLRHCAPTWKEKGGPAFEPEGEVLVDGEELPGLTGYQPCTVACFDLTIGEGKGQIAVALPTVITALAFVAARPGATTAASIPSGHADALLEVIGEGLLTVEAEMQNPTISAAAVASLRVGQVLLLEQPASEPAVLTLNGHPAFAGALEASPRRCRSLRIWSTATAAR
jgi:flagellar motor switch protein FliM